MARSDQVRIYEDSAVRNGRQVIQRKRGLASTIGASDDPADWLKRLVHAKRTCPGRSCCIMLRLMVRILSRRWFNCGVVAASMLEKTAAIARCFLMLGYLKFLSPPFGPTLTSAHMCSAALLLPLSTASRTTRTYGNVTPPASSGLDIAFRVSAASAAGLESRGLNGGNHHYRKRRRFRGCAIFRKSMASTL